MIDICRNTSHLDNLLSNMHIYYMAGSASGQDKVNPVFWLATRESKMGRSCPLGIARIGPAKAKSFGHVINPLLTKLVRSRWLDIGLVLLCVFMDRDEIEVHKNAKKNFANIQPS